VTSADGGGDDADLTTADMAWLAAESQRTEVIRLGVGPRLYRVGWVQIDPGESMAAAIACCCAVSPIGWKSMTQDLELPA
jgi:hypothetical protein